MENSNGLMLPRFLVIDKIQIRRYIIVTKPSIFLTHKSRSKWQSLYTIDVEDHREGIVASLDLSFRLLIFALSLSVKKKEANSRSTSGLDSWLCSYSS